MAPEDTPAAIAEKISRDVVAVVKDPEIAKSINDKLRMDPIGSSNREAARLFDSDAKLWAKVIQDARISLD